MVAVPPYPRQAKVRATSARNECVRRDPHSPMLPRTDGGGQAQPNAT